MPPLTADELTSLRADIVERGIVVPVVVDQHGRVLDGHHRRQVAAELGIDCPTTVREVADDDEALDIAVALNAARRHLSQDQRRDLIRSELHRRPKDADRAIARRVGCSPTTVGTVRSEWRAEAEESTERVQEAMRRGASELHSAAMELVCSGANLADLTCRARTAADAAAAKVKALGGEAFEGDRVPLVRFYASTCLANGLDDLGAALAEEGWSQDTAPKLLSDAQLGYLTERLFQVSNLDTCAASIGGAR